GFMPTVQGISYGRMFGTHTVMGFVPGMGQTLDFPDVLSLHAPRPTMVLQSTHDDLFTLSSMEAADKVLSAIYAKLGRSERYKCNFYPHKHMFTLPMQDEAFSFFDRWFKA